jgi:hypothetical protein
MATIFPLSASVGQIYEGYTFDGDSWNFNGIKLTGNYVTEENIQQIINDGLIIDGNNV